MEALRVLSYTELIKQIGRIACPFSSIYEGPLERFYMDMSRLQREDHCSKLCGILYPRLYRAFRCPCWIQGKRKYVKKRFWQQLEKTRKEAQSELEISTM